MAPSQFFLVHTQGIIDWRQILMNFAEISGVCDNAIVKWWTSWRSLSHIAKNKNPRAASCFDAIIIINMSFIHSFILSFIQSVSSIPPAIVSLSLAILTQTTTERGPIKLTSYRVLYSVLSLLWHRLKECIHIQRIKPCPAFKTLWSTVQGLLQSNLQNSNKMKHAKANDTWLPWNLLICQ